VRDLVGEYVRGESQVTAFYARPPATLFDCEPRIATWDSRLVDAIRSYQKTLGTTTGFEGNEAVIITGQQPAIFTGPLYTIYKAVTTIRLAEILSEKCGDRCVPVFWVGSEDHDFEEARCANFLTKSHGALSLSYDPAAKVEGLPMHRVPVEASLHEFVDRAAAEVPRSEYHDEIARFLHETLDASSSLADWTARLMARLFRDTPLLFFSPHIPEARALGATIIEKEIREPLRSTELLNEAGKRLEGLDFQPQVMKGSTECNLFLEVEGRRRKVTYERGRFVLPEEDVNFSQEELLALLETSPERFSPNVALRCVMQQYLFPVAAYVAGPGEIAYWAQLKPLFEHFKMPMPVVYPRAECTLTTIKLNKILSKLGLEVGDLLMEPDSVLEKAMRNTTKNPGYALAETQRQEVQASLEALADGLERHDKTAASMARGLLKEIDTKFDRLERTLLRSDDAKLGTTKKQLDRLCTSLAPRRKPQERVYTIFSFLFEHGWELVPRLLEEMDVESFQMNELEL